MLALFLMVETGAEWEKYGEECKQKIRENHEYVIIYFDYFCSLVEKLRFVKWFLREEE